VRLARGASAAGRRPGSVRAGTVCVRGAPPLVQAARSAWHCGVTAWQHAGLLADGRSPRRCQRRWGAAGSAERRRLAQLRRCKMETAAIKCDECNLRAMMTSRPAGLHHNGSGAARPSGRSSLDKYGAEPRAAGGRLAEAARVATQFACLHVAPPVPGRGGPARQAQRLLLAARRARPVRHRRRRRRRRGWRAALRAARGGARGASRTRRAPRGARGGGLGLGLGH